MEFCGKGAGCFHKSCWKGGPKPGKENAGGAAAYGYSVYTMKGQKLYKKYYQYTGGSYGERFTLDGKGISKGKFKKFEKNSSKSK